MKALGAECHVTGDTVRAVLADTQQDAAIDALRRERIRLIAITPLRTSLEAYFVEKLQHSQTTAGTHVMTPRIVYIASNTFREAVRDRVLYNLIAFALLLSGAAIFVGQISIEIERLVVVNLGLTAVSLVRSGHRHLHRHRAGLEGNRKTHALHRPLPPGTALGIYCRQVLWAGGHAGREYVLHGHRRLRRAALRRAQVLCAGCAYPGRVVLHRSGISDFLFSGAAVFLFFVAAAVGGVRLCAVHHWQLCRRLARICEP